MPANRKKQHGKQQTTNRKKQKPPAKRKIEEKIATIKAPPPPKKKEDALPPPPPPLPSSSENEDDASVESTNQNKGDSKVQNKKVLTSATGEENQPASSSSDDDDDSVHEATSSGFTDENATWLKPSKAKKGLLDSDDDGEDNGSDSDSSSAKHDGDDNDEMLEVEEEAEMIDRDDAADEEEAADEMQRTIREQTSIYHLPTPEEVAKTVNRVVAPTELKSHIESILEVLAEFKNRREPGRARKEYIDLLGTYIAELHGYLPELVEYFLTMFTPAEAYEFVIASDKARPLVIRTNTLKTRRKDLAAALIKRGVSLDPLDNHWSKVGLKIIDSPVPIGATPEYLTGHYMLQSAASMCPVMALAPQPKEKVLDMSAAPGGKTSYISQLMRNTGVILANDLRPGRQKATVANLHRLGVKNVVTCAKDGRKLGFVNQFDRILLDAPCSGLGVISRDPSVKVQRTIADIQKCAHLQKELLLSAIDALKYKNSTGCVMVYSTCSVSVYENEEVVDYALRKRDIQIVDTGLAFGSAGFTRYQQKRFHPSVALCRRFYPHTVNMDGFFVCKIRKLSDRKNGAVEDPDKKIKEETAETVAEMEVDDEANGDGKEEEKPVVEETKRKSRIAVPPPKPKKKQRQNAKVTKPRRWKATAM